jgi:hypothetical protein
VGQPRLAPQTLLQSPVDSGGRYLVEWAVRRFLARVARREPCFRRRAAESRQWQSIAGLLPIRRLRDAL